MYGQANFDLRCDLTGAVRHCAGHRCRGNGRFPDTEKTGGLAEIAVGADGARNLKNPVRNPATSPLVTRSLPVVGASMKGRPIKSGDMDPEALAAVGRY